MNFVINLLIFLLLLSPAQAKILLRFQTQITPEAKQLREIVLITPDKQHWGTIKLDSNPQNGDRISKEQIIAWMEQKIGSFTYQWQGKNKAWVHQNTLSKAPDLVNKARTALLHQLKNQGYSRSSVILKTQLRDSVIPLDKLEVHIPKDYPVAKRICVRLHYKKHSIPIWFAVTAYKPVLVARHNLKGHTRLQPNDVVLQEQNIAGLAQPPLTWFPTTHWIKHALNKNHIMTRDDLILQPDVLQGQKVIVKVQQQNITLTTEALAQNDAYIGQTIQMKNPHAHKYFKATIIGKNLAEIAA